MDASARKHAAALKALEAQFNAQLNMMRCDYFEINA